MRFVFKKEFGMAHFFPGRKYTLFFLFCLLPEGAITIIYWLVSPSSAAFLIASTLVVTPSLR